MPSKIEQFHKQCKWYIRKELADQFNKECRARKLKPNAQLELLLQAWIEYEPEDPSVPRGTGV